MNKSYAFGAMLAISSACVAGGATYYKMKPAPVEEGSLTVTFSKEKVDRCDAEDGCVLITKKALNHLMKSSTRTSI